MRESAALEQALLGDFGFAFRTSPNGDVGFYRTSGDDVFMRRQEHARAQTDTQPADADLRISAYTAEPGTPSHDALTLLASWAATPGQAETAHAADGA